MKLTVELDDGTTEVYQNLTDLYVSYRYTDLVAEKGADHLVRVQFSRSRSWGGNLRELVKEVAQSLVELQDHLRGSRHGGSS